MPKLNNDAKNRVTKGRDRGRQNVVPTRTFTKQVTVLIQGTDAEAVKKTASDIYKLKNDFTQGGRNERSVQITPWSSSDTRNTLYARH